MSDETEAEPAGETPSKWPRRIVLLTLLLAAAVFFLPEVVSRTPLGRYALDRAAEYLPDGARIGGVSLSWLRPVGVRDFTYADADGRELVVGEVTTDTPLWRMLLEKAPPGALTFRGIDVTVDLDAPSPLPEFDFGGGGEEPAATDDLPDVSVERLNVTLRGGPLREPVLVRVAEVRADREGAAYDFAGGGELVAGETAAPLTLTGTYDLGAESGGGTLTLSGLRPEGLLSRLKEPPLRAAGELSLKLVAEHTPERTDAELGLAGPALRLQSMTAGSPPVDVKDLKLLTKAAYDPAASRVEVPELKVGADLFRGDLSGAVDLATGDRELAASLDGRLELLGPAVALAGLPEGVTLDSVRFEPLAMRHEPAGLSMNGEVRWPRAAAYGLVSTNGRVEYGLDPRSLRVTLADVPVGTGRAVGTYDVDLAGETPRLRFAGGDVLRGVTLTEDLCRDWLRYVSPTLSRATDVSGTFGLSLDPVDAALDGVPAASGALRINGARLKPGPLADELIGVTGQLSQLGLDRLAGLDEKLAGRELASLPAQNVRFAVDQTGVAHRGFTIRSGKVGVTTEGRVGFDERLTLAADVSLPEGLARDKPLLAGILARPIRIPVTGTLNQPRLDRTALRDFGRNAARGAAGGLIRSLLDR